MPPVIQTPRLSLLPFTKIICQEALNGSTVMLNNVGITPCKGWPDLETLDTLPRILINLDKVQEPSGFESWMIIERSTSSIIGDIGFKGLPDEAGEVDLGYGIMASERKKGFALEAATGIVKWVLNQKDVRTVTANCHQDNSGSQRILSLLGFSRLKQEGEMIYWRLPDVQ